MELELDILRIYNPFSEFLIVHRIVFHHYKIQVFINLIIDRKVFASPIDDFFH